MPKITLFNSNMRIIFWIYLWSLFMAVLLGIPYTLQILINQLFKFGLEKVLSKAQASILGLSSIWEEELSDEQCAFLTNFPFLGQVWISDSGLRMSYFLGTCLNPKVPVRAA